MDKKPCTNVIHGARSLMAEPSVGGRGHAMQFPWLQKLEYDGPEQGLLWYTGGLNHQ